MSVGVLVQCENLLACGKEEKKFTPPSTKHGASMWSQDWKPYGILACRDVQCFRDHVGDKERSAKGFGRTGPSPSFSQWVRVAINPPLSSVECRSNAGQPVSMLDKLVGAVLVLSSNTSSIKLPSGRGCLASDICTRSFKVNLA